MMWLALGGFVALWLTGIAIAFLGGLYVNRGMRRIPEHPVLRSMGREPVEHARYAVGLRLVNPPPYDQDRESRRSR